MTHHFHRPRTLILPPAPYAAAVLGGWWLDRNLHPLPWEWGGMVQLLGWLVAGLGAAVLAWTLVTCWLHRTTVNPYKAATRLCTTGPFRYSRNPIYLGDWFILVGASMILATWWPLLFAPLVWLLLHYGVIRHEEAHLAARFGDSYLAYQARVRRWL
ncbi:methyltransferase family protein [Nitrosomonas sp. ANs5]|uniref:methyltransferase family protein n=1 Tax=Nitrosomonas sp. ANs5 TaxID=3423941 RepID=UPI003D34DDF8